MKEKLKAAWSVVWKVASFIAKAAFVIWMVVIALSPGENAGNRAVAAAILVCVWISLHAHEAKERHREIMARLNLTDEQRRYLDSIR